MCMLLRVCFPCVLLSRRFLSSQKQNCIPVKLAYNTYKPSYELDNSLGPVLFLHSVTSSKENWIDIPQKIADVSKRMAFTVDMRNHGDSEWSDVYDCDNIVNDTFHCMDSLNIKKAILVGHSMGGTIAFHMALKMPNRVEKLILEEGFLKTPNKEMVKFIHYNMNMWYKGVHKIPNEMTETEAKKFMVDYVYKKLYPDMECASRKEYLYDNAIPIKRTSEGHFDVKHNNESLNIALEKHDTFMTKLQGIYDGPTYFIYGTLSPFSMHEDEKYIRKHFPRLEMIKFDDGRHNIHIKFPEKFTNTVLKCILSKD